MVEEPPLSGGEDIDVYINIVFLLPVVIVFGKNLILLPFSANQLVPRFQRAFVKFLGSFGYTAYDRAHK